MIELRNIHIAFQRDIINQSHMIIEEGKMTVISGESGCGKTTLLKHIALFFKDAAFDYYYDGKLLEKMNSEEKANFRYNHIVYIAQDIVLLEDMNVIENLRFFSKLAYLKENDEMLMKKLDSVHLKVDAYQKVNQLSIGERQRLSIICGLMRNADVFLFDEPGAYLDDVNKQSIIYLMKDLTYLGKIVVVATHEKMFKEACDTLYEIKNQTVIQIKDSQKKPLMQQTQTTQPGFQALQDYIHTHIKKDILHVLIHCLFIALIMTMIISLMNYRSYQKNILGQGMMDILDHCVTVVEKTGEKIDPHQQATICQTYDDVPTYSIMQIPVFITGHEKVSAYIQPYLPYEEAKPSMMTDYHSDIYISYTLNKIIKNQQFDFITYEGLKCHIEKYNIVSLSHDNKNCIIYVPYDTLELYLKQTINRYEVDQIMIEISSFDDISIIKKNLPSYATIYMEPAVETNYKIYQIMTSPYIYGIAVISLISLIIYEVMKIMKNKRFLAFLQSQGISIKDLIKMYLYEESIMLVILMILSFIFVIVIFLLLDIFTVQSFIRAILSVLGLEIIYEMINLLIYIIVLYKNDIASLMI